MIFFDLLARTMNPKLSSWLKARRLADFCCCYCCCCYYYYYYYSSSSSSSNSCSSSLSLLILKSELGCRWHAVRCICAICYVL